MYFDTLHLDILYKASRGLEQIFGTEASSAAHQKISFSGKDPLKKARNIPMTSRPQEAKESVK